MLSSSRYYYPGAYKIAQFEKNHNKWHQWQKNSHWSSKWQTSYFKIEIKIMDIRWTVKILFLYLIQNKKITTRCGIKILCSWKILQICERQYENCNLQSHIFGDISVSYSAKRYLNGLNVDFYISFSIFVFICHFHGLSVIEFRNFKSKSLYIHSFWHTKL